MTTLAPGKALRVAFGETIAEDDIRIGMPVQVVPRMFEDAKEIQVHYTLEQPGTGWIKTDSS